MEKQINDAFKNEIKSLITKIKYLEISEAMKKPCDMDTDLVSECADFILEAENRQIFLTDEERKALVGKIPFKNIKTKSNFYNRRIIKALIIVAIILVMLVVTCVAVKPIRNFFTNITSDGTFFTFDSSKNNNFIYSKYNFIPEGYVLVSDNHLEKLQQIEYANEDYKIHISSSSNNSNNLFINSENAVSSGEIEVGSSIGYFCINKTETFLMWSDDNCNYVIIADNCDFITVDTLVKIAMSKEKI